MKLNGNAKKSEKAANAGNKRAPAQKAPAPANRRPAGAAPAAAQRAKQAPSPKKPVKSNQGGSKTRMPIIIAAGIATMLVVAFMVLGFYVSGLDTIYPKVSISGIKLGGEIPSAAEVILDNSGFNSYEDKSVSLNIPVGSAEGQTLTISAEEAGVLVSSAAAARMAYDYGRDGNFFSNTIKYIGCLFGGKALSFGSEFTIDELAVRDTIELFSHDVNAILVESDTAISEDSIKLIKGGNAVFVDQDEVYNLIESAFKNGDYSKITYQPKVTDTEDINLQQLYDTIYVEPKNSAYDKNTNGVTEHVSGLSFDIDDARRLWDDANHGQEVVIPLIITEPEITSTYLQSVLFANLLGQKSTSLGGSSASRVNNIKLASEAINGLVLNPGEEFSYNDVVGERTIARGYQAAGAYSNGEVVQEVGGGICQVSSTLYYSALLSNLEITNRLCHYFGVTYLPAGLDATVSWGGPEFKFKNDRDYPIRIEAGTDMTTYTVYVKIYGTDVDGSYVQLTSDTWGTAKGYGAVSYRWIYAKDGTLIEKRQEATSEYHHHTTNSPSPSASPDTTPSGDPISPPPTDTGTPVTSTPTPPTDDPTPPTPSAPVDPTPAPPPPPTSDPVTPPAPDPEAA